MVKAIEFDGILAEENGLIMVRNSIVSQKEGEKKEKEKGNMENLFTGPFKIVPQTKNVTWNAHLVISELLRLSNKKHKV